MARTRARSLVVTTVAALATLLAAPASRAALSPVPRSLEEATEQVVTGGYVMTHEHPTVGMAFGGDYAFAGATGNYQNGIMENAYTASCGGCAPIGSTANCNHGEIKGNFTAFLNLINADMGDHASHKGPYPDSFSHLQYSSAWIKEAFDPAGTTYDDARMKVLVAFAIENEAMCELLHEANQGNGGPGGAGYACSTGDSWDSLTRQIASIKSWAAAHATWAEIAYSAADARRIVNANKLAVVIGVEAEYAFGAEDRSFDVVTRLEAYHELGVRTFYLAHKLNSRLSGADVYQSPLTQKGKAIRALQAISGCLYYDDHVGNFPLIGTSGHDYCSNALNECGLFAGQCGPDSIKGSKITDCCNGRLGEISETNMALWTGMGDTTFDGFAAYPATPGFAGPGGTYPDGDVERNELGLSLEGERVVRRAMELGMIVNMDHVSSEARTRIHDISVTEFGGYPLNALHNNPSARLIGSGNDTPYPSEYDFTKVERDWVRDTGGIFGVRLAPLDSKEYAASGVTVDCPRTATENAKILAFLLDEGQRVGYSLDFAGGTEATFSRTNRACGTALGRDWIQKDGVEEARGLAHIGMMKYWHKELAQVGLAATYVARLKSDGAEQFLDMWEDSERQSTF